MADVPNAYLGDMEVINCLVGDLRSQSAVALSHFIYSGKRISSSSSLFNVSQAMQPIIGKLKQP